MISQIVLDNSKLTPGYITAMLVVFGAFLDTFSIYDKIIELVGGGAMLPITSFGHSSFSSLSNERNKVIFFNIKGIYLN